MADPVSNDPTTLLAQHLKALEKRGQKTVFLSSEARQALAPSRPASLVRETAPPVQAPEKSPALTRPPSSAPAATPTDKRGALAAVRANAEADQACKALGTLRDTFVFATGNPDARLVFVGEAPGYDEERQREPFVGKAGQLLDKIINAMGLQRADVYISNIVKWRPKIEGRDDQGTANRKPSAEEMEASRNFVLEELKIIKPGAVVALGASAAQGLLGIEDSVARLRNQFHTLDGIPVMVTYHPAFLLRSQSNADKRKVWEDLLLVMERLGMPISDKQRRFFRPKS